MAGGGSGERLMRALADAHIPFIAGALNIGDSDHTLALRLANEVITEQPYAPISTATLEQVHKSLAKVTLLILCPMPVGPGNLVLLQEALTAAQHGVKVLMLALPVAATSTGDEEHSTTVTTCASDDMLQQTGIANRDYTNGEGVRLVRNLQQAGAIVVGSVAEAADVAKRYTRIPGK
jgi:iron complex transport system ATP-binding protein